MNLAPFCTFFTPTPGMSQAELEAEIAALYRRQKAIDACVHGEMDEDDLYDLLSDDGIDPEEWANTAADNIGFLLGQVF